MIPFVRANNPHFPISLVRVSRQVVAAPTNHAGSTKSIRLRTNILLLSHFPSCRCCQMFNILYVSHMLDVQPDLMSAIVLFRQKSVSFPLGEEDMQSRRRQIHSLMVCR